MKMNTLRIVTLALLPVAMLTFTSCSSTKGHQDAAATNADDYTTLMENSAVHATVTVVDTAHRTITLTMKDGKRTTFNCGLEVGNLSQLQVGDQVDGMLTEEFTVFLGQGKPPAATENTGLQRELSASGPGGMVAGTVMITARITGIDAKKSTVMLSLPDGTAKTAPVGKQVNLDTLTVGDDVSVRYAQSLVIKMNEGR